MLFSNECSRSISIKWRKILFYIKPKKYACSIIFYAIINKFKGIFKVHFLRFFRGIKIPVLIVNIIPPATLWTHPRNRALHESRVPKHNKPISGTRVASRGLFIQPGVVLKKKNIGSFFLIVFRHDPVKRSNVYNIIRTWQYTDKNCLPERILYTICHQTVFWFFKLFRVKGLAGLDSCAAKPWHRIKNYPESSTRPNNLISVFNTFSPRGGGFSKTNRG